MAASNGGGGVNQSSVSRRRYQPWRGGMWRRQMCIDIVMTNGNGVMAAIMWQ